MSIMKNRQGKWLQIMLLMDSENAETHSVSRSNHLDARKHRNRLLLEYIQEKNLFPYTKITDMVHMGHSSQITLDSNNNISGHYMNFVVSPEASLFLMKMEIRPSMLMTILSGHAFDDKILNSFHIDAYNHANYSWVESSNDKPFGLP